MKHSNKELFDVVYRYYPRGALCEDPGRTLTEENRRLEDARRQAGADCDRWLGLLRRLADQFPENGVSNLSVHLVTGRHDACYSGSLSLPRTTGEHWHAIELRVSILVPYYIVYSSRIVDDREEIEKRKALRGTPPRSAAIFAHDTLYVLPAWVGKLIKPVKPELMEPRPELPARREDNRFDLSADEQPYAVGIAQNIEATWGYERMTPEVGRVIVPDVATDHRLLGKATLYDCLFSDNW
jgi:hypothetical protein